ncbi:hypothetical protein ACHAXR_012236 [Thalassiosira sp. AJA248-18]
MYTKSCTWTKKPSADRREGGSLSHPDNDEEDTEKKRNNHSSGASPINQRATNAILLQLSSPPNILTLSRILATPYLSYLLISHHDKSLAADTLSTISTNLDQSSTPAFALSLFLFMGFTDYLDGFVARTFPSTATVLGTYLDPLADKIFISVLSLTLWYTGSLPGMLVGLWVARDVGIMGSVYWLVRQETARKRSKESIAVMDPQNTPLKVQASFMSKVNTSLQIGLIALGIAGEVPCIDIPPDLMTTLIWITAGTTIGSSLGYVDGSALKKSGNK